MNKRPKTFTEISHKKFVALIISFNNDSLGKTKNFK